MQNRFFATFVHTIVLLFLATASHALETCVSPAQIVGESYTSTSIQDAYDHASQTLGMTNFNLLFSGEIHSENLYLDSGTASLDGGYDCAFTTKVVDISGLYGTVFISNGTLIAEDVRILSSDRCDIDRDLDGYTDIGSCSGTADDCNDKDITVFPGAPELCDFIDNNCDGQIDEDPQPFDADGDGYYGSACGLIGEDCNDANASIHPGALDIADDGIDQDCDGSDLIYVEGAVGGDCIFCHPDASSYDGLHSPTGPTDGTCIGCHATFVTNILPAHYGRTVLTDGNNMTAGQMIDCKSCHDQIDNLHNFGLNQIWSQVKLAQPNVSCDTCHTNRAVLHQTDTAHDDRIIIAECADCHNNIGSLALQADVDAVHTNCSICHNYTGTRLNATTVRDVIIQGISGTPVDCYACHTDKVTGHIDFVHPIAVGPNDLSYNPPGILCANCHQVSTWSEVEAKHNVSTNGDGPCATCHNSTRSDVISTIARGINPTRCLDCHADKYLAQHGSHDHSTTISGSAECTGCHTHSSPGIVSNIHNNSCAKCHNSPRPEIPAVIRSGQAECIDCHSSHDGQSAHNNLEAPESCAVCHTDKVTGTDFSYLMNNHAHPILGFTTLEKCQRCHNSIDPNHISTIDAGTGENGSKVYCTGCHATSHVPITVPYNIHYDYILTGNSICSNCHDANDRTHFDMNQTAGCADCHISSNQDEYNAVHLNDCLLCHLSPRTEVIDNIYAGISGTPVECATCHSSNWETTHQNTTIDHSSIVTVDSTNCANCHDDTLIDSTSMTHFACTTCHDATTGVLISLATDISVPGDCTTCHGTDFQNAHPSCFICHDTPPSQATPPNSEGAHFEHNPLGFGSINPNCVTCHNGLTHNNGTVDIAFPASFNSMSGTASSNGSTCSSVSCHGGQTTPPWTGTIDVETQCTLCHTEGTTEYNSYNSGKHWKHTSVLCTDCHSVSSLALGHFTNLETPTFEQAPASTIGGSDTQLDSYDGNRCFNISCHINKGW